jgi:hypothetical protein
VVDDETLLAEVEKLLNDRPLWPPSSDSQDDSPLTPNHFLLMHQNSSLPPGIFNANDNTARKRWKQANYLSNVFWRRWIRQYLPTLQKRSKWTQTQENLHVGDVVMVQDDTVPRGQWPLGLITATFPDDKGLVRIVDVRVRNKVVRRPIHKLCLFEQA